MKTRFTSLLLLILLAAGLSAQNPSRAKQRFFQGFGIKQENPEMHEKKRFRNSAMKERILQFYLKQNQDNSALYELESLVSEESWKTAFQYNTEGLVSEAIDYHWNETMSDWEFQWREVYNYDNGELYLIQEYVWDSENSEWVHEWKTEISWENDQMILVFFHLNPDFGDWILTYKEVITFNEDLDVILHEEFYWDDGLDTWIPDWKIEYTYDDGLLMLALEFWWDEMENDWIIDLKEEYNYDENLLVIVVSYWVDWAEEWFLDEKYEYELDEFGDQVEGILFFWDWDDEDWFPAFQIINTFDYDYTNEQIIYPEGIQPQHMILSSQYLEYDGEGFVEMFTIVFNYREVSTSIPEIETPAFAVYPNPANDHFIVSTQNSNAQYVFRLFDVRGRTTLEIQVVGYKKFNTGSLKRGMYFYQIESGSKNYSGKLIIN